MFFTQLRTDTSDQWTFFFPKIHLEYLCIYIFITGMICWNGDCSILEASEFLSWSSRFGIARDEGDHVYLVPESQPIPLMDGIGDFTTHFFHWKMIGNFRKPCHFKLKIRSTIVWVGVMNNDSSSQSSLVKNLHKNDTGGTRKSHPSGRNLSRTKTVQRWFPAA